LEKNKKLFQNHSLKFAKLRKKNKKRKTTFTIKHSDCAVAMVALQVHLVCAVCILIRLAGYPFRVHSCQGRIVADLGVVHNDVDQLHHRHIQKPLATLPTASLQLLIFLTKFLCMSW
jgi:hypothetical protein